MESYISSRVLVKIQYEFNPLSFWKREEDRLPRLAKVARVVYAFAATSTSCERSFSLARKIIGHRRHRLSPLTIQQLISMHFNSRLLEGTSQQASFDIPTTTHIPDEDLDVEADDDLDTNIDVGSVFSKSLERCEYLAPL